MYSICVPRYDVHMLVHRRKIKPSHDAQAILPGAEAKLTVHVEMQFHPRAAVQGRAGEASRIGKRRGSEMKVQAISPSMMLMQVIELRGG